MLQALLISTVALATGESPRPTLVVVVGAEGESQYRTLFTTWADRCEEAARRAGAEFVRIGGAEPGKQTDRDALRDRIADAAQGTSPLWILLIGHGTFDGQVAKFNLRGPDVSATELAEWLAPVTRPLAIVNCASSSGPFINALTRPGRVVVTAAKSGHEYNFARFGEHFSAAIGDPSADLDKDGQTSLLEAYLRASAKTAEAYAQDGRLETEHALLDDNGDGLGTPADWFRGARAVRTAKQGAQLDGLTANQFQLIPGDGFHLPASVLARRHELERDVEQLRQEKGKMAPGEYYEKLELVLLRLSDLYAELEESPPEPVSARTRLRP